MSRPYTQFEHRPCIIKYHPSHHRYEAYNQDGRLTMHSESYHDLKKLMLGRDYFVAPYGTSWYHDIREKLLLCGVLR